MATKEEIVERAKQEAERILDLGRRGVPADRLEAEDYVDAQARPVRERPAKVSEDLPTLERIVRRSTRSRPVGRSCAACHLAEQEFGPRGVRRRRTHREDDRSSDLEPGAMRVDRRPRPSRAPRRLHARSRLGTRSTDLERSSPRVPTKTTGRGGPPAGEHHRGLPGQRHRARPVHVRVRSLPQGVRLRPFEVEVSDSSCRSRARRGRLPPRPRELDPSRWSATPWLALPFSPLCRPDCKGLCADAGPIATWAPCTCRQPDARPGSPLRELTFDEQ